MSSPWCKYKYRHCADWSISQGGFLQPGSLQTGLAVCVTCLASARSGLSKTTSLSACPRCGTRRRSSRSNFSEGGGKQRAARPQPALRVPALHAGRATSLLYQPRSWTQTRLPLAGFYGRSALRRCSKGAQPPSLRHLRPKAWLGGGWALPLPACNHSPALAGEFEPALPAAGGPIPVAPSRWLPWRFPPLRSEDGRRRFHQTLPEKVIFPLCAEISAPWKRRAGRGGEDCLRLLPGPAEIVCVIGVNFV